MNMLESAESGSQAGKPIIPGKYAESYEKKLFALTAQMKDVVEKMTNNPGELKRVYQDLLWKIREDILNLKKEENIGLTDLEKSWDREIKSSGEELEAA